MNNEQSISKRKLWHYVNKKINRVIHHYHVFSIISILFEEMVNDLKSGKEIKIHNFGTLSLKQLEPRKYHDINKNQILVSPGRKVLRFELYTAIRKKIARHLSLDKI